MNSLAFPGAVSSLKNATRSLFAAAFIMSMCFAQTEAPHQGVRASGPLYEEVEDGGKDQFRSALPVGAVETQITLSPSVGHVPIGSTVQFSVAATNLLSNNSVTWTLRPQIGTISSTGLYTAPREVLGISTLFTPIRVMATSVADPTKLAFAFVMLKPAQQPQPAAVGVAVTPATASVVAGTAVQLSASVTGTTNQGVAWTLSPAVGTVSPTGLYTAPLTVSSPTLVTIAATSVVDGTKQGSAMVTVMPAVGVTVTPATASVAAGTAVQLSASVTGMTNQGVTWTLSPAVGTVSSAGLYTAPLAVGSATPVTVTATSAVDGTKKGSAVVTVNPAIGVTVTPGTASLVAGTSVQLNAAVTGTTNQGVTWTVSPALGTISATGLYTAPLSVNAPTAVTATASSVVDGTKKGSAVVTVNPAIGVTVTPGTASVMAGTAVQLSATVTGTTNQGVTWTVSPALGTISATGLYTAPLSVNAPTAVTATASSVVDGTKKGSAVVTVNPAIGVTVTPGTASVMAGTAVQLSATVTGTTNQGVTWTVSPALGTISATGLYTAPLSVNAPTAVTATASSVVDGTKKGSAVVTVNPAIGVTVTPGTASVMAGTAVQLSATVTGTTNQGVTWTVSPALGTISATGLYTAPLSVNAPTAVTATASSVVDGTKKGSAVVTVNPAIGVTVTPGTASVMAGTAVQLSATVTGTTNQGVTWTVSPALGTLSTSGSNAVYTTPSAFDTAQTVEIRATSMSNPTRFATAIISLVPIVAVTVTPSSVTVTPGATRRFTAAVTGTHSKGVTWTASPAIGTVRADGTYTAPTTIDRPVRVALIAQSSVDPTKAGRAQVDLLNDTDLQYTADESGLKSLTYRGQSYFVAPSSGDNHIVRGVLFRSPEGIETQFGWLNVSSRAVRSFGLDPMYFEHIYNRGTRREFSTRLEWTKLDARTLKVNVVVKNNDPTDTLTRIDLSFLPFSLPGTVTNQILNIGPTVNQFEGAPVQVLSGDWGSVALWQDYPTQATISSHYNNTTQTVFPFTLRNYSQRIFERSPKLKYYEDAIGPNESRVFSYYVRFGGPDDTVTSLAPDALEAYRSAFPHLLNWPDRRPIGNWMMANGVRRSVLNPRGYFGDPTLDVRDTSRLLQRAMIRTQEVINQMNSMTTRPQGVIVWDLEGEEFHHAFTYVGAPNTLPQLAPEMDAVADSIFSALRNAGYRVGVTLRPMKFGTGTQLPATCRTDVRYDFREKFIKLDAPFPYRGYVCTATDTWTSAPANHPYDQMRTDDDNEIVSILRERIAYAKNRWGATLFYIDSNIWGAGGPVHHTIFRTLAQEFPDVLLMPEWEDNFYFGSTAPYNQANMGVYQTGSRAKRLYPEAFSLINMADADMTDPAKRSQVVNGVKNGDILLFRAWWSAPEIKTVESIYAEAAAATVP
jgi:hypothetical protein